MPNIGENFTRPYQDAARITADPAYGRVVCFCERVTAGEIRDAYRSPIPPCDLNGLRRRTRAMNGRCQGFYCGAEVLALADSHGDLRGRPPTARPDDHPRRPDHRRAHRRRRARRAHRGRHLAPRRACPVLVLDREAAAGGIPRHSDHPGYGIRDLKTFSPARPTPAAWPASRRGRGRRSARHDGHRLGRRPRAARSRAPQGRQRIDARAIILATGARERPRSARLVPGDRPAGVYTTGQLQNLVHLHHRTPGTRAVIVGAELVSWSAVADPAGSALPARPDDHRAPRPESYAAFTIPGRLALRLPVATRTRVTGSSATDGCSAVELEHLDTGTRRTFACDTVVFTGDWIPDNELARAAGLDIDPGTRGPLIDTAQPPAPPASSPSAT